MRCHLWGKTQRDTPDVDVMVDSKHEVGMVVQACASDPGRFSLMQHSGRYIRLHHVKTGTKIEILVQYVL